MKKSLFVFLGIISFLFSSCEGEHTSKKYLYNVSSHTLQVAYFDQWYYERDTAILQPNDSLLLFEFWSRGTIAEEQFLPSCILTVGDSVLVKVLSDSTRSFVGDFTNENRWRSDYEYERFNSSQTCTFAFIENDFVN